MGVNASFKMDPAETVIAAWHEAYVSFDGGKMWFAVGGGQSPIQAMEIIEWYRSKYRVQR
jgi:hypothetical protein